MNTATLIFVIMTAIICTVGLATIIWSMRDTVQRYKK